METKAKFLSNFVELLAIDTFYWQGKANFGDALNPAIIEQLYNIKVRHCDIYNANIMGIGSILNHAFCRKEEFSKQQALACQCRPLHVFSAGFMLPIVTENFCPFRPLQIHALRGKLSQELVEKMIGNKCDCVLADAGLLAPLLCKNQSIPEKKYKLGIIPHFSDYDELLLQEIKAQHEPAIIIDVLSPVHNIINQILSCETIISTSLHGLIVADACNVPNMWCKGLTQGILWQKDFKFLDYYSSFDIDDIVAYDLLTIRGNPDVLYEKIKDEYKISFDSVKNKQEKLLQCFPFQYTMCEYNF